MGVLKLYYDIEIFFSILRDFWKGKKCRFLGLLICLFEDFVLKKYFLWIRYCVLSVISYIILV